MSKVKVTKGKRYSDAEKSEIVEFIKAHDAQNGRGGKSAAVKNFGVSQISLSSWMKASGGKPSRGGKTSATKGKGSKVAVLALAGNGNLRKLKELTDLAGKIDKAESDLAQLRKRFDAIKGTL